MKTLILLTVYVLCSVTGEKKFCCSNNSPISHGKCPNETISWAKSCSEGAFMIFSNEMINNEDGSISLIETPQVRIPDDRYCEGSIENANDTIYLICFDEESTNDADTMGSVWRMVCCGISIVCLILTLVVYIILPNLRDLQGKCLMCVIFSLLMAFFFLAVVQNSIENIYTCRALAYLIYFWFFCIFSWINVVAFNVWRSVAYPKLLSNKRHLFLLYNAYGWGGPLIFFIAILICENIPGSHIRPNFGEVMCWFSGSQSAWAYFYGPMTVLICINIVLFILTARTLWKETTYIAENKRKSHKFKFLLCLKLFIIMGICWMFEPMSELLSAQAKYLWLVTDIINSLQGLLIFLLLIVFRKRVRRDLARRGICGHRLPQDWATMPNEECEELEEDLEEMTSNNDQLDRNALAL